MRIKIRMELVKPLRLPLGYHHILQSTLYHALSDHDEELGSMVHDLVQNAKQRRYKPFCYSQLSGEYSIEGKDIIFSNRVSFIFSTNDENLMLIMKNSLQKNGLKIQDQNIDVEIIELKKPSFSSGSIRVKILSPVTVLTTDILTKETTFFKPWTKEFEEAIAQNYVGKYSQFLDKEPSQKLQIQMLKLSDKSKYVTKYKDTYITAWRGEFRLEAEPEGLEMLYDIGLGAKNAQGFGLFEIV